MNPKLLSGKWVIDAPSSPLYNSIKISQRTAVGIEITVPYECGVVFQLVLKEDGNITIFSYKVADERT